MQRKARLKIAMVLGVLSLYPLSNQWERAFAELESSEISPDGCIRIDTYRPFWILPSFLHRIPDQNTDGGFYPLGMPWNYPMFRRAYEAKTNTFLGETIVYDAAASFDSMYWNQSKTPGRRIVISDGFPLLDSDRCADTATLSRLSAFYKKQREEHTARMKWLEEQQLHRDEDYRQWKKDNPVRVGPPDEETSQTNR